MNVTKNEYTNDKSANPVGTEKDENLQKKSRNKESIHSGHFMVSDFEADAQDDEENVSVPVPSESAASASPEGQSKTEDETVVSVDTSSTCAGAETPSPKRKNSQNIQIDADLTKLFQCMTIAYSQKLTSPKWNPFKGVKLTWKDKIRLNNIIWRAWHMQFVEKRPVRVCQFASPLDVDIHTKPETVLMEGKYWKRRVPAVLAEYKRWRIHYKTHAFRSKGSDSFEAEMSPINLDSLDWSLMMRGGTSALDDDLFMDFNDTLFSTLIPNQPYAFPNPREIARGAGLADFMQPGLVPFQPNLDDYMDTLGYQELLQTRLPSVPEEEAQAVEIPDLQPNVSNSRSSSEDTATVTNSAPLTDHIESCTSLYSATVAATAALEHPSYCLETKGESEAGMQIRREEVELGVGVNVFEPSSGLQNSNNVVFHGTVRGSGRRSVFASSQPLGTTQSPPKQGSPHPLIASTSNQTSKPLTHPHCLPGGMEEVQYGASSSGPSVAVGTEGVFAVPRVKSRIRTRSNSSPNQYFEHVGGGGKGSEEERGFQGTGTLSTLLTAGSTPNLQQNTPHPHSHPLLLQSNTLFHVLSSSATTGIPGGYEGEGGGQKGETVRMYQPIAPSPIPAPVPSTTTTVLLTPVPNQSQNGRGLVLSHVATLAPSLIHKVMPSRQNGEGFSSSSSSTSSMGSMGGTGKLGSPKGFPQVSSPPLTKIDQGNPTNTSPTHPGQPRDHRRVCHINAEQKRRCNIKNGFDMLHNLIPNLQHSSNAKVSKAAMLQKAGEYIRQQKSERSELQLEAEKLRQQIELLSQEINICQSQLPDTGAPVSTHQTNKLKEMFSDYVHSRTLTDYKFWVFSRLMEPLVESFNSSVSTSTVEDLTRTTLSWGEQHCSLISLRPAVMNSLRNLSVSTSILTSPNKLASEAVEAVTKVESESHCVPLSE